MKLPAAAVSRRAIAAVLAPLLTAPLTHQRAAAFDNALPEVKAEGPSVKPGPTPTLGRQKNGDLLPCLDGKPHCFSPVTVVGENEVDTSKIGRDWVVQPWTYSGKTVAGALLDIETAVKAYKPGQHGIDAGGFKVMKVKLPDELTDPGYLYVQFEAKAGYLDDMEFLARNGKVQVRTSSRVGYLDLGTNAARYNWFAKKLGATSGWSTSAIRKKDHLNYFGLNEIEDSDVL